MSTSMTTSSGIVFVFEPPWMTLGENVVCAGVKPLGCRRVVDGSDGVPNGKRVQQSRPLLAFESHRLDLAGPNV